MEAPAASVQRSRPPLSVRSAPAGLRVHTEVARSGAAALPEQKISRARTRSKAPAPDASTRLLRLRKTGGVPGCTAANASSWGPYRTKAVRAHKTSCWVLTEHAGDGVPVTEFDAAVAAV